MKIKRSTIVTLAAASTVTAGMALTAAPASAVDITWFEGKASHGTTYTQGAVQFSQTGTRAGFTELTIDGQARITVNFGAANTQCWSYECAVGGARSYEKGSFSWVYPGGLDSETVDAQAWGTGLTGGGMSAAPVSATAGTADVDAPQVLVDYLSDQGAVSYDALGTAGGTSYWKVVGGDDTAVYAVTEAGDISGAKVPTSSLGDDSLSFAAGHDSAESVLYVPGNRAAAATLSGTGYTEVGDGLFVKSLADSSGARAASTADAPAAGFESVDVDGYTLHGVAG